MFPMLHEASIQVGLEAENRDAALKRMVESLTGSLEAKVKDRIYRLLLKREKFGTTAVGDGIALPHCIFSGVSIPIASLGISREGIVYPSLDGGPVYLIYMLILPQRDDAFRLKSNILRDAEKFFRDRFLRERLKISETQAEAYEILKREAHYYKNVSLEAR